MKRPTWRRLAILWLVIAAAAAGVALTARGADTPPEPTSVLEIEALALRGAGEGDPVLPGPVGRMRALLERAGANPGVGFTVPLGTRSCWEGGTLAQPPRGQHYSTIDTAVQPFPPNGNGGMDPAKLFAAFHGGTSHGGAYPCGQAAELFASANGGALSAAAAGKCSSIPLNSASGCGDGPCDGSPTTYEMWLLALTTDRCGAAYRECWWGTKSGGSPALAIPISPTLGRAESLRACSVGQIVSEATSMCGGWPAYYRVTGLPPGDRPWCASAPPPPPPPPPPSCGPYTGSPCEVQCGKLAARWPDAWNEAACRAATGDSNIAKLCANVCPAEDGEEGEKCAPLPVVTEVRWKSGSQVIEYVPGVPSTGRLELDLFVTSTGGGCAPEEQP